MALWISTCHDTGNNLPIREVPMRMRSPVFTLALILTFATGMPAQGRVEETAGVQAAAAPPSVLPPEDPQDPQNAQGKPNENPPEPESHGTRLRWQDIPKN